MSRKRYQYVQKETSRHGRTVWYFRIGNGKRTRLHGEYGSDQFVAEWRTLVASAETTMPDQASKNTLQWLVDRYHESAAFKGLAPSTQRMRKNILKSVCQTGGKLVLTQITRQTIASGRDRRADTPHAAINFMKVMGYLFEFAVDAGYMRSNPVRGVKRPKIRSEGFMPWTDDDIRAFYEKHPLGSMARLAIDLFLWTGLRRGDMFRLGPQHIRDGVIEFRASKNAKMVYIEISPSLARSLDACETHHLAFLTTPVHGRPFKSAASFGNWFGKMCAEAGISPRAHGLRKKGAIDLAELGGTTEELKARFGWKSDAMAGLYTREADRRRLAKQASKKLNENALSPHLYLKSPHPKKNN
ncbi:integrase [Martelella alba]|uniref:Integrase n=2 Tax=Martelella alba TaxID=2590451 RepID=A0A506U0N0_9HYPH|nr:integrase [Martelella alba]